MPVILKKTTPSQVQIGLWRIAEEEEYFLKSMPLTEIEVEQLAQIKGARRLHWLASRYLLHLMTKVGDRIVCVKDEFGKPGLYQDDRHIGFSHSGELAAVVLSDQPCGIDIQTQVSKISSIAHKFIREDELIDPDSILNLHLVWGAKEAAYKAYGRKKIDFKQHMKFTMNHESQISLQMSKDDWVKNYVGQYELWGEYVLVYLKETEYV